MKPFFGSAVAGELSCVPAGARPTCEVAEDVILEHDGPGVVIHPNATIGRGVRIDHGVTFGCVNPIGSGFRILVEDGARVRIGAIPLCRPGRTLKISHGAFVGAGAVVTNDVPARQRVVGVPAGSV